MASGATGTDESASDEGGLRRLSSRGVRAITRAMTPRRRGGRGRWWVNGLLGILIVLIVIAILGAIRGPGDPTAGQRTVTVTRATVAAVATATGTVIAPGAVDLSFPTPGLVTSIDVRAGQAVRAGEQLATISDVTARQQVASANSALVQAQASAGNASSQLALVQDAVTASNASLDDAVIQAEANLTAAQASWSEACLNPADPSCPNPAAAEAIRAAQNSVTSAQLNYDIAVQSASTNKTTYDLAVRQASDSVAQAQSTASWTCSTLGSNTSSCRTANDAILTNQQALETATNNRTVGLERDDQAVRRASMALSDANVSLRKIAADLRKAQQDAVRQARQARTNAETARDRGRAANAQSLANARATGSAVADGPSASDAAVQAARAGLATARRSLDDTVLRAPVDGTVGAISLVVGESSASAGGGRGITVVPAADFQAEADFAESEAASISSGQVAEVTFEGLPGVRMPGRVLSVDPVAREGATNNLVTFAVRVSLDGDRGQLREGMTATIAVTTALAEDVLAVPASAITTVGNTSTVDVRGADGVVTQTPVTLGLRGESLTEIIAGVRAGDVLIIPNAESQGFPTGGVPGENRQGGGPPGSGAR